MNGTRRTERSNDDPGATDATPARPRKLGHVVVGSRDALASRRFFVDGVGFSVSDEVPGVASPHALLDRPSQPARPAAPASSSITRRGRWATWTRSAAARAGSCASTPSGTCGARAARVRVQLLLVPRDPAGNFVEYYSDLDVIVDEEVWKVRASSGVETLAVWGPPLPTSFLMPEDLLG